MIRKFLFAFTICAIISCESGTEPEPNPTNTNNSNTSPGLADATLKDLPEGLPKKDDCFLTELNYDLNGAASDKVTIKVTYDKYNRIVKSEASSQTFPNVTTYTYEKGKVKIVADATLTGNIKTNTVVDYILDDKNRVKESVYTVKTNQANTENLVTTKSAYTYDSNGFLIEIKSEDNKNITKTIKNTWQGGNLIKAEYTEYNDPKNKFDKYSNITTYELDMSKTNGSWDVNSVTGTALAPSIAYFGKINKNIILKVSNVIEQILTVPIAFNTKMTVMSDYKYTFDGKGNPSTFLVTTNTNVTGSFPISIPVTTVKGNSIYSCN
jgi:hypothetical protein